MEEHDVAWDGTLKYLMFTCSDLHIPCQSKFKKIINDYYKKGTQIRIYELVVALLDELDMWEPTNLIYF